MNNKLISIFTVALTLSCSKDSKNTDNIQENKDNKISLTEYEEEKGNKSETENEDDGNQYFIYKEDNPMDDSFEDTNNEDNTQLHSMFGLSVYDTRYGTGKHNELYCSKHNFLKPYSSNEPWINMFPDFYKNSTHSNSFCIHYNHLPSQTGTGWVKDCGFGKVLINDQCEELLIKYSEDKISGGKFQVLGQSSGFELVRSRSVGEISMPIGSFFTDTKDFAHLPYYEDLHKADSYYANTITYAYQTNEEFSFAPSKYYTRLALQSGFEKINGFYGGSISTIWQRTDVFGKAFVTDYGLDERLKYEYERQLRRDKKFTDMRPELIKQYYNIDDNFLTTLHIKIDFFGKNYNTKNHTTSKFKSWCKSLNHAVKIPNAAFTYEESDNVLLCDLKELKAKPDYTGYERLYGFSFAISCGYKNKTECGFLSSTTKRLNEKFF